MDLLIPSVTMIALYKMLQDPSPFSKKKHNSIAYHKVHESMTTNSLHVLHEPGNTNLADVFTKLLPPIKQWQVVNACNAMVILAYFQGVCLVTCSTLEGTVFKSRIIIESNPVDGDVNIF